MRVAAPRPNTTTTSPKLSPVAPASPDQSSDPLPLFDRSTTTPSRCLGAQRPQSQLRRQAIRPRPDNSGQHPRCLYGPAASHVSSGDGSACSKPCHEGGRTHYAPSHSLGINLPTAQSPPGHDDEQRLQTLRSLQESITARLR